MPRHFGFLRPLRPRPHQRRDRAVPRRGTEEQAAAEGVRQQKPRCTAAWQRLLGQAAALLPSKSSTGN